MTARGQVGGEVRGEEGREPALQPGPAWAGDLGERCEWRHGVVAFKDTSSSQLANT